MKRVVLALAAVAVLCIAANQAQAAGVAVTVGGWDPPAHVVHHHGWRRPVVVHPPVFYPPRVIVPAYPPVVYPPVYSVPRVYYGGPNGSFYYRGPGVSLGVGF